MRSKKAIITRITILNATAIRKSFAAGLVESVSRFKGDLDKKERLNKGECAACYYLGNQRIGGSSVTHKDCGICDFDMVFPSTSTNVICKPCGKENGLCVHCGGDIDMKERRKPYPFMENKKSS